MKAIKAAIYTALGAELTWAWMMGHTTIWGILAIFCWSPLMGFDLAYVLSPWAEKIGFFGPEKEKDPSGH